MALPAVEQSTGSHQGSPREQRSSTVLPELGTTLGESFLTNTIRRSYLAARKGEGKHKMEDEVRTRGTEDPWWIFSFHADAAQRQRATSCSVAVCVTGHCRWASGEGGKGRALVLITENLQKAMAVCFQPHPDPVIMDALIITCLLKLKNRGQKFTLHTQHCSCEL